MSSLEGLSWQQWPPVPDDDLHDSSTQSSLAPSPQPPPSLTEQDPLMLDPSPSLSPKQASSSSASAVITCDEDEDVMRLPRRDMHIFGQCPIQDEFVLVTCDVCGRHVKMEAFEHHFRLRHDKDAVRVPSASAVGTSVAQRMKRNVLRPCTVELTKDDLALSSLSSSSSSSSGHRNSLKQSTSPSPVLSIKEEPEPMEVDQPSFVTVDVPSSLGQSSATTKQQGSSTTFVSVKEEEADSTTSNVISIPDTDPLPHSVSNDLMAMVSGELSETATVKTEPSAASVDSTSAPPAASGFRPKPMIKLQIQTPVASPMQKPHLQPTVTLASAAPGESLVIKKGSPSKKGKSGAAGERKPQREYHPDRHCGVWDNDNKRHCTRALTCKSHSVLLKRKVEGRSRNFDELVAEHKAVKEANAAAAAAAAAAQAQQARVATAQTTPPTSLTVESVLNSITEPNPIESRPKMPTAWSGPVPQMATPTMTTVKGLRVNQVLPKRLLGSRESDENLHYTTDHPRPLAVCTLGAKRLGGLYVSDRSQFLTRKVIRVAIAANGLRVRTRPNTSGGGGATVGGGVKYIQNCTVKRAVHAALQPRMQQQQPQQQQPQQVPQQQYMVNYNVTRPVGLQVSAATPAAVTAAAAAATRIGGVSLSTLAPGTTMAVSSTTGGGNIGIGNMPPNINIVPAGGGDVSFKTDIQDFKGGIKFELGRKIKHILPMGTEVTK